MKSILISTSSFNSKETPQLSFLKESGFKLILNPFKRKMTSNEVETYLQNGVVAMIAGVEPLSASVLAKAKSLSVISRCGSGLDNVDLIAAARHGISVYSTMSPINAVAELAVTHMLALLRKVVQSDRSIRQGEWKPLMGNLLASKTVGIVGFGHIGMAVANLVRAFGARVIYFDEKTADSATNYVNTPLDELLIQSDIVTLHLPYNTATHHMINREKIKLMKKSALIINTSRGGVIDELSLHQALIAGELAGAGMDVFEKEPYQGPLSELDNVVLTSHMGSYAHEARIQMELEAVQNLFFGLKQQGLLSEVGKSGEFAN